MSRSLDEWKRTRLLSALQSCRMFAGLPEADLKEIAEFSSVRTINKGEYLFYEGDVSVGFFIVQQGAINVHRVNAAGKEQVIRVFRDGETFGEATLADLKMYPGHARAETHSQIILVQRKEFLALVRHAPELALRMVASLSLHLRELVSLIEDLTLKDVEARLAEWLIKHCPQSETDAEIRIELGMPKRVWAAELGTVSETLSRTLGKFRDQGLIRVEGTHIVVISPKQLGSFLKSRTL